MRTILFVVIQLLFLTSGIDPIHADEFILDADGGVGYLNTPPGGGPSLYMDGKGNTGYIYTPTPGIGPTFYQFNGPDGSRQGAIITTPPTTPSTWQQQLVPLVTPQRPQGPQERR